MHRIIGLETVQSVQWLCRQRFVKDFKNVFPLKGDGGGLGNEKRRLCVRGRRGHSAGVNRSPDHILWKSVLNLFKLR